MVHRMAKSIQLSQLVATRGTLMWDRERRYSAPVTIGPNAKIGANCVVLQDIPPGATAVGIPVISKRPLTIDNLAILFVVRLAGVSVFLGDSVLIIPIVNCG
jgi:hypothetical protein